MFESLPPAVRSACPAPVLLTGLVLLFCFPAAVPAQLNWDRKFADLHASPEDGQVEVRFPFVNEGRSPVTVQKLKSSCGCTTASLAKASYAPGERGEVVAVFEIGNRIGVNEKNVTVTTNDPDAPQTVLGFRVYIWKTVLMTPAVLFWKPGGEKTTQTIRIKVVRDKPLNLVRAECSSPVWRANLETIKPGWEYEVKVTCLDSRQEASGVMTVVSDSPMEDPQIFRARLRVK